jgi:hypothetical protein
MDPKWLEEIIKRHQTSPKPVRYQAPQQQPDRINDIRGRRSPYSGEWGVREDTYLLDTPQKWVQSACVLFRLSFLRWIM